MKKSLQLIVLIIFLFFNCLAQESVGIKFESLTTWNQIKEKAKNESKYIFIDGFTTWCVPCKMMENEIFTQKEVGDYFNKNFINLRVQFDISKKDNEYVKSWREQAKIMELEYKVNSYPTFLFLDSNGILLHKFEGASDTKVFIEKSKDALDPSKQFFNLKAQYIEGTKDSTFLFSLYQAGLKANDLNFASKIGNEYLTLQKNLLSKKNLNIIAVSTNKSTVAGFKFVRDNRKAVDEILGEGESFNILKESLLDEIVIPYLIEGGKRTNYGGGMISYSGEVKNNINWDEFEKKLNDTYPELSPQMIFESKLLYFELKKDWVNFSKIISNYIESEYFTKHEELNKSANQILRNTDDPKLLEIGINCSKKSLSGLDETNPRFLYTLANLNYKLNHKEEALSLMNKAIIASVENKSLQNGLKTILTKMERGEKTW